MTTRGLTPSTQRVVARKTRPGAAFRWTQTQAAQTPKPAYAPDAPFSQQTTFDWNNPNFATTQAARIDPSAVAEGGTSFVLGHNPNRLSIERIAAARGGTPFNQPAPRYQGGGTRTYPTQRPIDMNEVNRLLKDIEATNPDAAHNMSTIELINAQLDALRWERDNAIAQGQADVAAEFDAEIARVSQAISKAQGGKAEVGEAYDRYRVAADQGFARGTALLPEGDFGVAEVAAEVGAEVTAAFTTGLAEVDKVVEAVSAGDTDLQAALSSEVTEFQAMAEDALAEDLGNDAKVIEAGNVLAARLMESAQADDRFYTDLERQKVEAEIQAQIDKMIADRQAMEEEKQRALDKVARDIESSWGPLVAPDLETGWGLTVDQYLGQLGLNVDEQAYLRGQYDEFLKWSGGVVDRNKAKQWASSLVVENNIAVLEDAGIFGEDGWEGFVARADGRLVGQIQSFLANPSAIGDAAGMLRGFGFPIVNEQLVGQLRSVNEDNFKWVQELAGLRNDWVNSYENRIGGGYTVTPGAFAASSQVKELQDPRVYRNYTKADMTKVTGSDPSDVGYLHPAAAQSYNELKRAAENAGFTLNLQSAWRSWALQEKAWKHFMATGTNLAGNKVPNIAHPSKSRHPSGLALDMSVEPGSALQAWLRKNAANFGWKQTRADEPWEWQFVGVSA